MWDDIEELDPSVEPDSYQGNLLLVFLDSASPCDMELHAILEKKFARAPGGRDLRFSFAFRSEHEAHHKRFGVDLLPAAVFVREGVVYDRGDSADEIIELARELIKKYS